MHINQRSSNGDRIAIGSEIPDHDLRWVSGGTGTSVVHYRMEDLVVKGDKPPTGGHRVS